MKKWKVLFCEKNCTLKLGIKNHDMLAWEVKNYVSYIKIGTYQWSQLSSLDSHDDYM